MAHFDPEISSMGPAADYAARVGLAGHTDYPAEHPGVHLGYTPTWLPMEYIFGDALGPRKNVRRAVDGARPDVAITDDIVKALGIRNTEESRGNPIINGPTSKIKSAPRGR